MTQSKAEQKPKTAPEREARVAEALRANLRKRKQQQQERAGDDASRASQKV